ncbi:hypothetical protein BA1DRAFT_00213 [Photorhabdus aegyptia]|uniref:Uncharacterized protein n=1 Tax=Photorhabdus aegyptia TaxID=2805098 RepID=A0A022PNZ4_9GAMM|nr:hypothetical protein BA1DRAFT_00213 [Photorhabdus aegyptia]
MKKNYAVSSQIMNTIEMNRGEYRIVLHILSTIIQLQRNLFVTLNNHLIMKNFMIMNYLQVWDSRELN